MDRGNLRGAITELRETIRLKPDSEWVHDTLGTALGYKGDLDNAVREHREAIRLKPDIADFHLNLGNVLAERGESNGAIVEFREAIRLSPNFADAHNNLGSVLREKGDQVGSIAEFREAFRSSPTTRKPIAISAVPCTTRKIRRCPRGVQRGDPTQARLCGGSHQSRSGSRGRAATPKPSRKCVPVSAGLPTSELETPVGAPGSPRPSGWWTCPLGSRASCGRRPTRDTPEMLVLVKTAYHQSLHAGAARLYVAALDSDPKLARDRIAQYAYHAVMLCRPGGMRPGEGRSSAR